jgi:hypothetical protein
MGMGRGRKGRGKARREKPRGPPKMATASVGRFKNNTVIQYLLTVPTYSTYLQYLLTVPTETWLDPDCTGKLFANSMCRNWAWLALALRTSLHWERYFLDYLPVVLYQGVSEVALAEQKSLLPRPFQLLLFMGKVYFTLRTIPHP